MFVFGSGALIGTPTTGTPINFGLVQEVSLKIATTTKPLYGEYNFPVAIGQGTRKLTGTAKLAKLSGYAIGQLYFGVTPTVGATPTQFGEAASVPASSPYTYQAAKHATFVADQGVVYAATGLPLKQVASGPTVGQYSVAPSTGTYTFAAADEGAAVLVCYTYTVATGAESIAVNTALIGAPSMVFAANLFANDAVSGAQFSVYLYNCIAANLSFGTKLEDFVMPDFEFEAYANAAGQVMLMNFGDLS
jgi:hypothetical protein